MLCKNKNIRTIFLSNNCQNISSLLENYLKNQKTKRFVYFYLVLNYSLFKLWFCLVNRFVIDYKSKMILLEWFKQNSINPYANKQTKKQLSEETGIPISQISAWLKNQRAKTSKNKENNTCNRLSTKEKIVLKDYFENVNRRPDILEIQRLSSQLNRPERKISSWFSYNRFITGSN